MARNAKYTDDLPGGYALLFGDLLSPWKITLEEVLAASGLSREHLESPSARIPLSVANDLLKRAIELTGEPAIGVLAGLQMKVSHHGYIGFAAMTARNVGQALRIAERFAPLRSTAVDLQLMVEGDVASLTLVFDTELEPLRQSALIAVCVGLVNMARTITGKVLTGRGEMAFPRPDYMDRFEPLLAGNTVVFDQPANRLVIPSEYLDLPLVMADPVSSRIALEQCERELAALGEQAQLIGRMRGMMQEPERGFLSLEDVASRLHVSPRTLKRQLAAQGTTFSDELDDLRRQRALLLLGERRLSLERVAERLGYSDVANFTRAFRRWTGTTPGAWRSGGQALAG
jgi:AraC-like DNA-binding protein